MSACIVLSSTLPCATAIENRQKRGEESSSPSANVRCLHDLLVAGHSSWKREERRGERISSFCRTSFSYHINVLLKKGTTNGSNPNSIELLLITCGPPGGGGKVEGKRKRKEKMPSASITPFEPEGGGRGNREEKKGKDEVTLFLISTAPISNGKREKEKRTSLQKKRKGGKERSRFGEGAAPPFCNAFSLPSK